MARRRITEQPTSRLAIWARRIALFSLAATFIAIIIVRSGALEIVPALSTFAGALALAVLAILLAFGAAVSIWKDGVGGMGEAVTGLLIGVALIAYPLYLGVKAYQLPAIYDITTDPIDPPRFDAIARLRPRDANPVTYAGPLRRRAAAYGLFRHRARCDQCLAAGSLRRGAEGHHQAQMARGRCASAAGPARARRPHRGGRAHADPGLPRRRRRARARHADGARIDVRSSSRYGRHDFGTNAARVRSPDRR